MICQERRVVPSPLNTCLNNLIFQLFNPFILPSSMLVRLVNISMFRCNNKTLFVTSSFVGWLIGHILFMKWVKLILVWIEQNNFIRSNKYLVSELRNSMARIFSILLFITRVYYLGRIPSPILTKKLKETEGTKQEQEESDIVISFIFHINKVGFYLLVVYKRKHMLPIKYSKQ